MKKIYHFNQEKGYGFGQGYIGMLILNKESNTIGFFYEVWEHLSVRAYKKFTV